MGNKLRITLPGWGVFASPPGHVGAYIQVYAIYMMTSIPFSAGSRLAERSYYFIILPGEVFACCVD